MASSTLAMGGAPAPKRSPCWAVPNSTFTEIIPQSLSHRTAQDFRIAVVRNDHICTFLPVCPAPLGAEVTALERGGCPRPCLPGKESPAENVKVKLIPFIKEGETFNETGLALGFRA